MSAPAPLLPPSMEEAYRRKCIDLRRKAAEVEESNDALRLKKLRLDRGIRKLRLERAFLLEALGKRMAKNGGMAELLEPLEEPDSDDSSDAPTPKKYQRRPTVGTPQPPPPAETTPRPRGSHQSTPARQIVPKSADFRPTHQHPASNGHVPVPLLAPPVADPPVEGLTVSAAFREFYELEYLDQAPRFAAIAKSEADLFALAERAWYSREGIEIRQVYESREGRDPVVIAMPKTREGSWVRYDGPPIDA